MLTITHPYTELAARFRWLIIGLCAVVAAYIANDPTAGPLVGAIYMRLRRCSVRFDGVVARLIKGVTARHSRGERDRRRAPRELGAGLLPRHRAWLVELLNHEAAAYGGYDGRLGYLLRDPAMVALLAASPQIGRVLRPLWRMLSKDKLPAVLRPSPRLPAASCPGVIAAGATQDAVQAAASDGAPPRAAPQSPDAERRAGDASAQSGSSASIPV